MSSGSRLDPRLVTHNLFTLPIENSFCLQPENLPALTDPPEQPISQPMLPQVCSTPTSRPGLSLYTTTPKTNVLGPRNTEYYGSPSANNYASVNGNNTRCACGLEKEVMRLRQENQSLKTDVYAFQRTFTERLSKELRRKETELISVYEIKHQSLESNLKKQLQSQHLTQDSQTRNQYKIYQKYIQNLQSSKQSLYEQLDRLKKQLQNSKKLQQRIRQLESQKQSLQESVMQRESEMNQTIAQITMESQYRKSGNYVEELEKTNMFLQKENKRVNAILLERIRSGMH